MGVNKTDLENAKQHLKSNFNSLVLNGEDK